jgi:endonuclease/exonuclease/phosphatase family metal-dependent hydrolase
VKLVTWNIQWGRGLDGRVDLERIVRTARAIADFDVFCVQEVADNFPSLEGNDDGDQFAKLSALLPEYQRVDGFGVDVAGEGKRRRRFGNAIFTRYAVSAIRRHALPWPADPGKESMPRVAVEATLAAPLGALRVTTTHLEYYSDVQRRAQAARLRELHDDACARAEQPAPESREDGPFAPPPQTVSAILTGDFNFPPEHPCHDDIQQPLRSGGPAYRDAWVHLNRHQPHPPTFCVFDRRYSKTPYCCDFIYASENLLPRVRSIHVESTTRASDHQPVLLDIDDR